MHTPFKHDGPDISIIVPCLNEEQNIPILLQKLMAVVESESLSAEILIVDDCSDDYTFRAAFLLQSSDSRVRALHKGLPRGIGHAIRFGIDHAHGRVGVVAMGDCVDPLAAIPDFHRKIVEEGNHLVLLSRYIDHEDSRNIPFSYRFYQWWYRHLARLFVGMPFRDITYAFRGFDLAFIRNVGLNSGGFEISPEITFKIWLANGKVCELKGRQGRRFSGESKFFMSKEGYGYARVLLGAAITRLVHSITPSRKKRWAKPMQG